MTSTDLNTLYQSKLMAHHQDPQGFEGESSDLDWPKEEGFNPACGDEIVVYCEQQKGLIKQLRFSGYSCAICRGSASIMCQQLSGKEISEVHTTINKVEAFILRADTEVSWQNDIDVLRMTHKFPVRKQCALLPWQTLKKLLG